MDSLAGSVRTCKAFKLERPCSLCSNRMAKRLTPHQTALQVRAVDPRPETVELLLMTSRTPKPASPATATRARCPKARAFSRTTVFLLGHRDVCYLEGHGDLVNRLITPISHIITPIIPIINPLKSPP